jgi:hypothetical protein
MSPTNQEPLEVRTATAGSGDDRWSRWAATGEAHDRASHRRAVMFAAIVVASLAVWGTLAIVVR